MDIKTKHIRSFNGSANAGFRVVDGIGHKVDAEHFVQTKLSGGFNGFDPARLIKKILVLIINPLKHPTGTFTIRTPHQSFVTNNLPALPIDNRLKCHSDFKAKCLTTQTIHTTLLFDPIRKFHAEPLVAATGAPNLDTYRYLDSLSSKSKYCQHYRDNS